MNELLLVSQKIWEMETVLRAAGWSIRKAAKYENLLDAEGFDRAVVELLTEVQKVAAPAERKAIGGLLSELDAAWVMLEASVRSSIFLEAAKKYLTNLIDVPTAVVDVLNIQSEHIVGNAMEQSAARHALRIDAGLTVEDARITKAVAEHQAHYVKNQYAQRIESHSKLARDVVQRGFKDGLDPETIAKDLHEQMLAADVKRSMSYWETVSSTYCARSRSYGELRSFEEAGFEEFQVEAVLDEVTCFEGATHVLMADGSEKRISEVLAGDRVVTCTGREREVSAVRIFGKRKWIEILAGGSRVVVTPNHPFFTAMGWVRAGNLAVGARLVRHEGSDLQNMWQRVSPNAEPEALLFDRMQKPGACVRELRVPLSNVEAVCGPRAGTLLFVGLSENSISQGSRDRCATAMLCSMRERISCISGGGIDRQASGTLFETLSATTCTDRLFDVRQRMREEDAANRAAFLFCAMLPSACRKREGTSPDETCSGGTCEIRCVIRDGSEVGSVACGFFGDEQIHSGDRWCVLASQHVGTRCDARSRVDKNGLCGGSDIGQASENRSVIRDPRLAGLWPYPIYDFEERASFVTIESIVAYETEHDVPAYDVEVEDDAGYIAAGFVVHNTNICRMMHGKRFSVRKSLDRYKRVADSEDPEDVKFLQPWVQQGKDEDGKPILYYREKDGGRRKVADVVRSGIGTLDDTGVFENVLSQGQLEKSGITAPPYHGRCRTTLIPVF